jgi:microcystin-dependent protein
MAFAVTKTYDDGTDLTEAQLDAAFGSIETLINTTGLAAENIQSSAITAAKIDTGAVTTAKIDSAAVTIAKLAAEVTAFLIPTGTILPYGGASAPTGFLLCDGSAVSRTTYATLFGVIGETAGQGDNSTTFNVPDLRGRFLRGWDNSAGRDPDAADRTTMATGGNSGDNIFSVQADATAKNSLALTDPGHTHTTTTTPTNVSQPYVGSTASGVASGANFNAVLGSERIVINSATTGITLGDGDDETRPLNAYVNFIIKT